MKHCKTLIGALMVPLAMCASLSPTLPPAMLGYATRWSGYEPANNETMWYYSDWSNNQTSLGTEGSASAAFLIGNGSLGACISGNGWIHFKLNEKGLFAGRPEINDWKSYQDLGSVVIAPSSTFGNGFMHQLDYSTGVYSNISYANTYGAYNPEPVGALEAFASYPDRVIAARYSCSADGYLRFDVRWDAKSDGTVTSTQIDERTADIAFSGSLPGELVSYAARVRVIADDGTVTASGSTVTVNGASAATVIIGALTDYDSASETFLSGTSSLGSEARTRVAEAASKGWDELYGRHVADHSALYGLVALDVAGRDASLPTDRLLDAYTDGSATPGQQRQHETMVFNYGRYLMIAASRAADNGRGMDCPSNLQGIWAHDAKMWNCDIHANINVQMNYWPAEVTGLGESHLALCDWLINLSEKPYWRQLAADYLTKVRGIAPGELDGDEWACPMAMNPFGGGTSYDMDMSSMTPRYNAAQAWLCSHLIQHYLYTLDADYLERALPVLWRACRFWSRNMDRRELGDGSYVYEIPFEPSPEQSNPTTEPATAHTQQLVTYLFKHTLDLLDGCHIAEATPDKIADLREKYEHLDNGMSYWTDGGVNYLREWKYADAFGEKNHRHLSHLVCMYPLDLAASAPDDVYESVVNAMHSRGYRCGDVDAAVWTTAWKVYLWARDHSPRAYDIYRSTIGHLTDSPAGTGLYYNLTSLNQCMQMEGNWGLTAGVAEMLLQSHAGYLDFLPALPSGWPDGSVSGLRAIGNHRVDIVWADGEADDITVTSESGRPVRMLSDFAGTRYIYVDGQLYSSPAQARSADGSEVIEIAAGPGTEVRITRTPAIPTSIAGITLPSSKAEAGRYDLSGRRVGHDYRGVVIVRYTDGTARKTIMK